MKLKPEDIFREIQDAELLEYTDNFIVITRKAIIHSIPTELVDWPKGVSRINRQVDMSQHIGKIGLAWSQESPFNLVIGVLTKVSAFSTPYCLALVDITGHKSNYSTWSENFRPGGIELPGWNMDGTRKEEKDETI